MLSFDENVQKWAVAAAAAARRSKHCVHSTQARTNTHTHTHTLWRNLISGEAQLHPREILLCSQRVVTLRLSPGKLHFAPEPALYRKGS
mmetsp:Transcript_35957/g.53683  ORF Transcript_35957/g.53683 Transcript_35957/m.53683 type:complete len:89 (-) Transcript_35957:40-306(-)